MKRKDFMTKYDLVNAKVLTEDQERSMIKELISNFADRIELLGNTPTNMRVIQTTKEFVDFYNGIENKTNADLTNVKRMVDITIINHI